MLQFQSLPRCLSPTLILSLYLTVQIILIPNNLKAIRILNNNNVMLNNNKRKANNNNNSNWSKYKSRLTTNNSRSKRSGRDYWSWRRKWTTRRCFWTESFRRSPLYYRTFSCRNSTSDITLQGIDDVYNCTKS